MGSTFLRFGLIGFKSLSDNIYHRKIPWVQFPENDIRNYNLILNTRTVWHGARNKTIIFQILFLFLLRSAVYKSRPNLFLRERHNSSRLVHFFKAIFERKKNVEINFFIFNKSVHSYKRFYFHSLNITHYS